MWSICSNGKDGLQNTAPGSLRNTSWTSAWCRPSKRSKAPLDTEQKDRAVGHRKKGSKAKRLFLEDTVYTMDLRSAHKTPEKPPPRLRLSLTRSLDPEDEDQPYDVHRQDPHLAHRKSKQRRSQFRCFNSNPPSPMQEEWEGLGEEEEEEEEDNVEDDEDGDEEAQKETAKNRDSMLNGQERTDDWSSAARPVQVTAAEKPDDVWRPVLGPGEVTVTDVTLNSLTVTFRESRVAKGFFRDWGLEV